MSTTPDEQFDVETGIPPTPATSPAAAPVEGSVWVRTQESGDFRTLRQTFRGFAFPLVTAGLGAYFAYVLLTAFARGFVNTRVGSSNITIGFLLGLLQFAGTFGAAIWYSRFANRRLDPTAAIVKAEVELELNEDADAIDLRTRRAH